MHMAAKPKLWTIEEMYRLPDDGNKYEVVRGELFVTLVRQQQASSDATWAQAPTPILIVEILSESTRRRDRNQKRSFYLDAGVDEYWIVDPETRTIASIRRDRPDVVASDSLAWSPPGADQSLEITLANVFADEDSGGLGKTSIPARSLGY